MEVALYKNTAIAECAVFGVPDDRLGEEVGAAIFLKPGEAQSADEIREACREHLAPFKVPRYIWVAQENLPRNASGKILKKGMLDLFDLADAQ